MSTGAAVRLSGGVIAVCLGTLLLLLAIPAALSASVIESSVGRSGIVTQSLGSLAAPASDRAIIVDDVAARLVAPDVPTVVRDALAAIGTDPQALAERVGDVALVATMASDAEGFLGVAPADAVNDYLDGSAYAVAVQPGSDQEGTWPTVSVPGTIVPADPAGQGLWAASATGTAPELPGGDVRGATLVLMRADASPGPEASLRLEYRVAGANVALQSAAVTSAALSVGGLALILLGGWLVVGRRPRA